MTACPPECWASQSSHCYQHCPNCQSHTPTEAALLEMFERYLALRAQRRTKPTREWRAQP